MSIKQSITMVLASVAKTHGPLFCVAVYPSDVVEHGEYREYTPLFVAHCCEEVLAQEFIDEFWQSFQEDGHNPDDVDVMDDFARYLEASGYLVLTSAATVDGHVTVELGWRTTQGRA